MPRLGSALAQKLVRSMVVGVVGLGGASCGSGAPPATPPKVSAPRPVTPEPGRAPSVVASPAAESPSPSDDARRASPKPPLEVRVRTTVVGQPVEALTSGQKTEGTVADVVFLPPDGSRVALGGNDDRAYIVDLATGKTEWRSESFGTDVEHVEACESRLVVQDNHGNVSAYTLEGRSIPRVGRYKTNGELEGTIGRCGAAVFSPRFGQGSTEVRKIDTGELMPFYGLGSHPQKHGTELMTYADPKGAVVFSLDLRPGERGLSIPIPDRRGPKKRVQMAALDAHRLFAEYVRPGESDVVLFDEGGREAASFTVEITDSVWVFDLPSVVVFSRDLAHFFLYRDGVAPEIVRVSTDQRARLDPIPRTMSATVKAAFSPYEPNVIAVTMVPKPNQVTVYTVQ